MTISLNLGCVKKENSCMGKNFVQACVPEKKNEKKVQQTSRLLQNSCDENHVPFLAFFPSGYF